MIIKDKGRKFLSDLKFMTDYSKWLPELNRYETWEESCEAVVNTHRVKYADKLEQICHYLDEAELTYKEKLVLASQRNLQFRGEQVFKHNSRIYNCAAVYMDKTQVFSQVSYLSLSGCGVGVSMLRKWVDKLPTLAPRKKEKIKNFIIPDSIEGWSDAFGILVSSFCSRGSHFKEYEGSIVRFDYSQIRPTGAMISGGFKAPGPAPLKQAIERIETLLENETRINEVKFRSIVAYDILMHIADAILSAGVRRSALSIIIDPLDLELIQAKTGNWSETNKQRERSNNSIGLIRGTFNQEYFTNLVKHNDGMSDLGFVFLNNEYEVMNPCVTGDMIVDVLFKNKEEKMRVEDVVLLHQKGESVYIKSKDLDNNEVIYSPITSAFQTKKNAKILKITDEKTGKFIRVTEEHLVFTENRGYVEAMNLKEDDILVFSS